MRIRAWRMVALDPPRRRGVSLVELVLVLGMLSAVLGAAVLSIGTIFQTERRFQQEMQQATSLSSLADRFTSDVRSAAAQLPAAPPVVLSLKGAGDEIVEYERVSAGLARVRHGGAGPVARELYRLPAEWRAAATTEPAGDASLVSLRLEQHAAADPAAKPRLWQAAAILARDQRWRAAKENP